MIGRPPREDTTLGPYRVSKHEPIYVAIWCLHRHEKLWEEPNAFDPNRFAPERIRARHRCAYLPFGAGRQYRLHGVLDAIAGGWRVSSIMQWHTGLPFTPSVSGTTAFTGGSALDPGLSTCWSCTLYAVKVGESEFDDIFGRVKAEGIAYGSGPGALDDMKINHRRGGRGFYFRDPNGHILEVLTA